MGIVLKIQVVKDWKFNEDIKIILIFMLYRCISIEISLNFEGRKQKAKAKQKKAIIPMFTRPVAYFTSEDCTPTAIKGVWK